MPATATSSAPDVLFLGTTYAGHATRFANLELHTRDDIRIRSAYRRVTGWKDGGLIERVPLLPVAVRGRIRAAAEAAVFAKLPRPDAIWLSAGEVTVPHLWSQIGPLRRPVILDLDSTPTQLEAMAPIYYGRPPKSGVRRCASDLADRALVNSVKLFTPWSRWAASGLEADGVSHDRIKVMPPGVDLGLWQPAPPRDTEGPLRVLFVGGDFIRKGGDLLLSAARQQPEIAVDIVTHDPGENTENVRFHRAGPNSHELRALFAAADVFVLPTRAECFGIAAVEAMAAGLPVIMANVGGAEDIVDHGETGWLIEPTESDLVAGLRAAAADRERLRAMGVQGRRRAERLFDGAANDRLIVDAILELLASKSGTQPA